MGRHQPQGRTADDHAARGALRLGARARADPGLQKDGVEAHLQELLAATRTPSRPASTLVRREYPTAIGPIDLVCRDADGHVVAVEVKRRGEIDGVEQLARYIERLQLDSSLGDVRGVFVAQVDQAAGAGARRGARLPLGRGRLRRASRPRTGRAPAVLSQPLRSRRHATASTRSDRPRQGRAGHHRDHRHPRPGARRGGRRRSRRAACATPTCTTARAASTTTSRSCSATRRPASSSRSATASPTWRPATT